MNDIAGSNRRVLTISGLAQVISLLGAAATVTGFFGRAWWIFELTSHLRWHLAVGLGLISVFWAFKRAWRWSLAAGLCAIPNVWLVSAQLLPVAGSGQQGLNAMHGSHHLRVALANVLTGNLQTGLVLDFLGTADADVVLLMEVDRRWLAALSPLRERYPEVIEEAREDNFGIALFSRAPIVEGSILYLGKAEVPSVSVSLTINGRTVSLIGTHPLPPISPAYAALRNDQLRAVASYLQTAEMPYMVIGDLNATPWSPYFQDLLVAGRLLDTSRGRGLNASWPAILPWGRIPVDHCLVSPGFEVVDKRLGPNVGSDHLPVVVDLRLKSAP